MSVVLTYLRGNDQIQVAFDAVVAETHAAAAQVTSHPVEKGSDVSDHVYVQPKHITLEALVTNTPLATPKTHNRGSRGEVSNGLLQFDQLMDRPRDVYQDFSDAMDAKSVFTVDTAIKRYEDMIIISMSTPREPGSGKDTPDGTRVDKLTFNIEMQQIRVVGSRAGQVTRKPKAAAPKPKQNKGPQAKKEATKNETALHKILF